MAENKLEKYNKKIDKKKIDKEI
jgi:hypothetical protein